MKIVIGTWSISNDYGNVDEDYAKYLLKECIKAKNFEFDTAPNYGYGKAEKILGKVSKDKRVIINTKIGNNSKKEKGFSIQKIKESFEKSLYRLKRNKINILFLHNPRKIKNIKKVLEFVHELKRQNKIQNYGISLAKNFEYSRDFLKQFNYFQLDFNIFYQKHSFDSFYKKKEIYIRSPFASGLIFKQENFKFQKGDHRIEWASKRRVSNIIKTVKIFENVCKKKIHDLSISFIKKSRLSNKVIFGLKNYNQLRELKKNVKKKVISEKEYLFLQNYYIKNIANKEKEYF